MKRKDMVAKLMTEGFTEKTLAGMTDKQLALLTGKILPEQTTLPGKVLIPQTSPTAQKDIATAKLQKKTIETYESDVKENQLGSEPKKNVSDKEATIKKLKFKIKHSKDKGKVEDAKKLLVKLENKKEGDLNERHGGKSPTGVKSHTPKTDAGGKPKEDKTPKSFADQRWNAPRRKGKMKEETSLNEWVNDIVGKNIYPFTSKNEIMELIQSKLTEQSDVEVEVLPDFLKGDSIMNAGTAEPTTKPAPVKEPGTKPTERPTPKTPFQPGPGPKHNPKAGTKV